MEKTCLGCAVNLVFPERLAIKYSIDIRILDWQDYRTRAEGHIDMPINYLSR